MQPTQTISLIRQLNKQWILITSCTRSKIYDIDCVIVYFIIKLNSYIIICVKYFCLYIKKFVLKIVSGKSLSVFFGC